MTWVRVTEVNALHNKVPLASAAQLHENPDKIRLAISTLAGSEVAEA